MKNGISKIFPATGLQQGFIYQALSHPEDDAYRIQLIFDYQEPLALDLYTQAWEYCIQQYPILRTAFNWEEEIIQIVYRQGKLRYEQHDISHLVTQGERDEAIEQISVSDRQKAFDLTSPTLFRLHIIKQLSNYYTVILTQHHSITDGWSNPLLLTSLHRYYESLKVGSPIQVEEDETYFRAQKYIFQHKAESQRYWQQLLENLDTVNDISALLDEPVPIHENRILERPNASRLIIEGSTYVALKDFCQSQSITLHVFVQFIWHKLLQVYSNSNQTVVGTTVSGRNLPIDGIEHSVGLYINTLPLVIDWRKERSIIDQLQEIQQRVNALNTHSFVDLAQLQRGSERMFQTLLVFENYPVTDEIGDLSQVSLRKSVEKVDYLLSIVAYDIRSALNIEFWYDAKYLTEDKAQQHLSRMRFLIDQVLTKPDATIQELTLLDSLEYNRIVQWGMPKHTFPRHQTVLELIAHQTKVNPEAVALVYEDQQLTYESLHAKSNQLAHHIRAWYQESVGTTLQPDTPIAIFLEDSLELVIGILAILKAGGTYVPLDPANPDNRILYVLQDAGVALMLSQRGLEKGNAARFPQQQIIYIDLTETLYTDTLPSDLPPYGHAGDLAYIIYTSGTTGKPKGVMIEHASLTNLVYAQRENLGIEPGSSVLQYAASVFDASVWEIFSSLAWGARLVIVPGKIRKDGQALIQYIEQNEVNLATLPPAFLEVMPYQVLPSLHTLVVAGETCRPETMDQWAQGRVLINAYGPTECTVCVTMETYHQGVQYDTIGKPMDHVGAYVLDENLSPVPIGVVGELYVTGAGLARGYINQPASTAQSFRNNHLSAEMPRMYRTGDLVRWLPEGTLQFVGRRDEQIKLHGYRIELSEIELVLEQQQGIQQARVVVHQRKSGNKMLVAYCTSAEGESWSSSTMKKALTNELPDYMVPDAFIGLDSIPLTINGKLDKLSLPDPDFLMSQAAFVGPGTEDERVVCQIWEQVLGLEKVGIEDDFFQLGGNSISAIKASHQMSQSLERAISVTDIFQHRCVAQIMASESAELNTRIAQSKSQQPALSFAQERLWFIEQYQPGNQAYVIPALFELAPGADITALKFALHRIVDKHEVLRTTIIRKDDGSHAQQVHRELPTLHEQVISEGEDFMSIIQPDIDRPFDLQTEYPIFLKFYYRSTGSNQGDNKPLNDLLLIKLHHIASDGWSMNILLQEIHACYTAFQTQGDDYQLPPLAIQYKDYAEWQRSYLKGAVLEEQLSYWKDYLSGFQSLQFPTDFERPVEVDYRGAYQRFLLDKKVSMALRTLSQKTGATLHSILLSSWHILLHKYTGQRDIVTGSVTANRQYPQTRELIGFFVNTQVNRTQLEASQSFKELIGQVQQQQIQNQKYQDLPFESIVDALGIERDRSKQPIFQVMFTTNGFDSESGAGDSVDSVLYPVSRDLTQHVEKFDISIFIDERLDEFEGHLSYATALFDQGTITRLIRHYEYLLNQLCLAPEKPYQEIHLIQPDEYQLVIDKWNPIEEIRSDPATIDRLFENQVNQTPDAIALSFEENRFTYRELNDKSNQLARHIRTRFEGVIGQPLIADSIIALYLDKSFELVISMLAVLKAGGAYVALDTHAPKKRIGFILEDTDAALLLTRRNSPVLQDKLLPVERVVFTDLSESLYRNEDASNISGHHGPQDLAYVIYTSGTTGNPKGVMIAHRAVASLVLNDYIEVTRDDVFAFLSSPFFDASTFEVWTPLLKGSSLVIPADTLALVSDLSLVRKLVEQTSVLWLTKTLFESLYHLDLSIFSKLKYLIIGGEALNKKSVNELLSSASRPRYFLNGYGPTESTTFSSVYHLDEPIKTPQVPIGKAIQNRSLYVLDESLHPQPVGVAGELYIGGAGLARGYLNQEELTKERFLPNPFSSPDGQHSRLYKTGDQVKWLPDGNLEFLGRSDQQLKIRGHRIELGEIEQVMMQVESITQACVVAHHNTQRPDSDKVLVGYYVSQREELHSSAVELALKETLPGYMVPDHFIAMESFPMTMNGKLDKKALPAPSFSDQANNFVAPSTELEAGMCRIWKDVLSLNKVGMRDDFFRIGGNSILAIQVSHQMTELLGRTIQVADLFRYHTISGILDHCSAQANLVIPASADQEEGVLSFAQERLWFIEQYQQTSDAYHIPVLYKLESEPGIESFKYAIKKIVQRHKVLRSVISQASDQAFGTVLVQKSEPSFQIVDVSEGIDLKELLHQDVHRPFDLRQEFPFRTSFYNVPSGSKFLDGEMGVLALVNFHHIASDGWSMRIFHGELTAYQDAYFRGDLQFDLPPLEIQYADFASWQRNFLSEKVLEEQLQYWEGKLQGYQTLEFPTDHVRPSTVNHTGARVGFALSEKTSAQARALAMQHGVTLHSLLLSCFNILLSKYTGQNDILTGSVIANRHLPQTVDLMGFFVNTQANRTILEDSQCFEELIQQVHQEQIQAQLYQDLPFERLVEALEVERDPSRHPVFQVMFGVISFEEKEAKYATARHMKPYPMEDIYNVEKFDLSMVIDESDGELKGQISYATLLFHEATISRLCDYFIYLTDQLVHSPAEPIGAFHLLDQGRLKIVLEEWNQTKTDFFHTSTVHQLFEDQVKRTPNAVAITFQGVSLSYATLNERSNQLARFIRSQYQQHAGRALTPDTLIALFLERSVEMVIGILGVLKAGAAYVPIDTEYPSTRIGYILEDSKASLILSQHLVDQRDLPAAVRDKVRFIDLAEQFYAHEAKSDLPVSVSAQDLAYVIYTSGTTGKPKGVMIAHEGVVNLVQHQIREFDLKSGDIALQFASYVFDASVSEIFTALTCGAQLSIVAQEIRRDASLFSDYLIASSVNVATLPPAFLGVLPPRNYPALKTLVLAGESCPEELMAIWSRGRKVINAYGPTENTVCATMHSYQPGDSSMTIGSPIANVEVFVLDRQMHPVPIGVTGELYLSGIGLARGYLNQETLTNQHFITNPFATETNHTSPNAKLYKTGDLVRWLPSGQLVFVGRNDTQVKVRGYRIELEEIKHVLSAHHAVSQAHVILSENPGGDRKNLTGYYVPVNRNSKDESIKWWPSIAEYYVYDDFLYSLMTTHESRNDLYRDALQQAVKGKTVVDIGTGPDAILTRICVEAGAERVYAIEYLEETYQKAQKTIELYGLQEKVTLIHGNSLQVSLPEKVDVCVSELVGAIGGSEGAAVILNDAKKRHVKPSGKLIPEASITKIALIDVPKQVIDSPILDETAFGYAQKIFAEHGRAFDLRLCLKGVSYDHLVSSADVFERLDWSGQDYAAVEETHTIHLTVTKDAIIYGCLVWLDLFVRQGAHVDILADQHSWIPIFMPLFPEGVQVRIGDELHGTIERKICQNGLNFDYTIKAQLTTATGIFETDYTSFHLAEAQRTNSFYQNFFELFDHYDNHSPSRIDRYLAKNLPAYMLPDSLVELSSLPMTVNGKVDEQALPDAGLQEEVDNLMKPETELERRLCQVYGDVLGVPSEKIRINKSFFKVGGNSILSIQLKEKLNQLEEFRQINVADLFQFDTIQKLVSYAQKENEIQYHLQEETSGKQDDEIAIIGLSGAFSGVEDVEELWQVISNQQEGVRFYSLEECEAIGVDQAAIGHPDYVPVEGKVKGIEQFDPFFWEMSPNEASQLDPQIRKFVEHCWFALESAGYAKYRSMNHIGVFAGSGGNGQYFWNHILNGEKADQINLWEASASNSKDALATKAAYLLNLSGPANSINTACSTGLVSVAEACKNLTMGACNMALAGGVSFSMPNQIGYLYQDGMILSRDGHCRTFDKDASGTTGGSGVGVVLLKKLSDALADQDLVLGVVKGYATNNDGSRKSTYTSPSVFGQSECIINAQKMAKVDPGEIDYVECHGTATKLGDPIEVQGLREAFEFNRSNSSRAGKTVLGSVKANLGHTDTAAGTVGLIKILCMFKNNLIPGQVNFEVPNPELELEQSGFEVIKDNREWLPQTGKQRLAGVSSFGIGGTNAHVILGDYPNYERNNLHDDGRKNSESQVLFVIPLSAKSRTSLEKYKEKLRSYLLTHEKTLNLENVAYSLSERRDFFRYRRAYVASSVTSLIDQLASDRSFVHIASAAKIKTVFMFPGQGSQYYHMAQGLYEQDTHFKKLIDECVGLANGYLEEDLFDILYPGEALRTQDIHETQWTQLVLFIVEYSMAKYLEWLHIKADAYLGHSIGEYVAATLSGVFTLKDAIRLVIARGRLIQSMPSGSMLSVKARISDIQKLADTHHCEVSVINSAEHLVLSGEDPAIQTLKHVLDEREIPAVVLNTSHAFHSKMMDQAALQFSNAFEGVELKQPDRPFISNVSGDLASGDEVTSPDYWCRQLRNSVRFGDGVRRISHYFNHEVNFLEVGPGKALSSFVQYYIQDGQHDAIRAIQLLPSSEEVSRNSGLIESDQVDLRAKLWSHGLIEKPNDHFEDVRYQADLPCYQFDHQEYWLKPSKFAVSRWSKEELIGHFRAGISKLPELSENHVVGLLDELLNQHTSDPPSVPQTSAVSVLEKDITDLHQQMAEVFSDILGVTQLSIHDDFFEVGGTSIQAIELSNRLSKLLDHELKVADVLKEKTIDRMLNSIRKPAEYESKLIHSYGDYDNQQLPNLIFVHPGNGGSEVYQNIADQLSSSYNCMGVNNFNILHDEKITDLNNLATHYLEAYEKQYQLSDPIQLFGWSLGGQIAIEMAAILENRGFRSIHVVLLDTLIPDETIRSLYTSEFFSKMKRNMAKILKDQTDDQDYINRILTAMNAEREIGNAAISQYLNHTRVTLFRAVQKDHRLDFDESDHLFTYCSELPSNNLDLVCEHLDVVNCDCHHGNILESEKGRVVDFLVRETSIV